MYDPSCYNYLSLVETMRKLREQNNEVVNASLKSELRTDRNVSLTSHRKTLKDRINQLRYGNRKYYANSQKNTPDLQ